MHITAPSDLKIWLLNSLKKISDADTESLAEYIIALLRKEKTIDELMKICQDQLEVFLTSDTNKFIKELFHTIEHKNYLDTESGIESKSNKKRYEDFPKIENSPDEDERDFKRTVRQPDDHRKDYHHSSYSRKDHHSSSRNNKSRSNYDDKYSRYSKSKNDSRNVEYNKKTKCPDFEENGFCVKGDYCPFDHGSNPVVLENNSKINNENDFDFIENKRKKINNQSSYNPEEPNIGNYSFRNRVVRNNRNSVQNRNNRKQPKPTNSTMIELKRIPNECNNILKIGEYFNKFGTVLNVKIRHNDDSSALVEFSDHKEAKNALASTDAVMGNRFIRMYWYNPIVQTVTSQSVVAKPQKNPYVLKVENSNTCNELKEKNQLFDEFLMEQMKIISELDRSKSIDSNEKLVKIEKIKELQDKCKELKEEMLEASSNYCKTGKSNTQTSSINPKDTNESNQLSSEGLLLLKRMEELKNQMRVTAKNVEIAKNAARILSNSSNNKNINQKLRNKRLSVGKLKVDNRPKSILVSKANPSETKPLNKEAVEQYFKSFGSCFVDTNNPSNTDDYVIINFVNPKFASMAVSKADHIVDDISVGVKFNFVEAKPVV